jgi:hypothetical protein
MKRIIAIAILLGSLNALSQQDPAPIAGKGRLTIEPGVGISPMPVMDVSLSNIIHLDLGSSWHAVSYSAIRENNLFLRNFNHIRTTNNISVMQSLGMGSSLHTRRATHSLSLMAGLRYDTYHESMVNPEFEQVNVTISSWSPDFGVLYHAKLGRGKYFLSYRVYLPLNPYPFKTTDPTALDGNLGDVSLEAGLGIRLN